MQPAVRRPSAPQPNEECELASSRQLLDAPKCPSACRPNDVITSESKSAWLQVAPDWAQAEQQAQHDAAQRDAAQHAVLAKGTAGVKGSQGLSGGAAAAREPVRAGTSRQKSASTAK